MKRIFWIAFLVALVIAPLAIFGCKGKVEKAAETPTVETSGEAVSTEATVATPIQEPAKEVEISHEGAD